MDRRQFLLALGALGLGPAVAQVIRNEGNQSPARSLYQPTRYAFIADKFGYYISIVDIVSGEYIDSISFGIMMPKVFEMARDDAMMAVGNPEVAEIHFYDLKKREPFMLKLPSPVYQIFFVPQTKWVAIGLKDQVGMINYQTREVKIFPERFDSPNRTVALNSYYALLFSSFSQSFWILDEEKPRIFHKYGSDSIDKPWEEIDLSPYISSGLASGVASPEDRMLALTTVDGSEGLVYFPENKKMLTTGKMYEVGSYYKPMVMPYIDAYSGRVLFAEVSGNVALFDFTAGEETPQRFSVDFSPRIIRSGWLERTWIIGGDRGLILQDFDEPENRQVYHFPYEITNMWVTGDSKTLLFLVDEEAPQLLRVDIRSKQMLEPIRVPGVVMGELVRMGSNNSLCY